MKLIKSRLELFRFHIHRLRCTSVFWAHFYSRLIQNFQILNTLTNGWIHGGYLNMTYVVEVPWFPLLLHKCILPFLKILEIWKFLHNLLLKSPTKMDVRLILRYMGPVYCLRKTKRSLWLDFTILSHKYGRDYLNFWGYLLHSVLIVAMSI